MLQAQYSDSNPSASGSWQELSGTPRAEIAGAPCRLSATLREVKAVAMKKLMMSPYKIVERREWNFTAE